MLELIKELKEKGYGIYLLSNASSRQHIYWERMSCHKYFNGTLISADVKMAKPDPGIYRLLFSTFSLKPEECFFIDDSEKNIQAAEEAGMAGYVFRNNPEQLKDILYRI